MRLCLAFIASAAGALSASAALAQTVPTPAFTNASPNVLRVEGLYNGQLEVSADGLNLWPEEAADGTFEQFQHIFLRIVSPDGQLSPWRHCEAANGCAFYAGSSIALSVMIDPRKFDLKTGAKLEMRYWIGPAPASAQEPQEATGPHSDWSNTARWDVVVP